MEVVVTGEDFNNKKIHFLLVLILLMTNEPNLNTIKTVVHYSFFQLQTSIVQYWSHLFRTDHTFSKTEVYAKQTESFCIAFRQNTFNDHIFQNSQTGKTLYTWSTFFKHQHTAFKTDKSVHFCRNYIEKYNLSRIFTMKLNSDYSKHN